MTLLKRTGNVTSFLTAITLFYILEQKATMVESHVTSLMLFPPALLLTHSLDTSHTKAIPYSCWTHFSGPWL